MVILLLSFFFCLHGSIAVGSNTNSTPNIPNSRDEQVRVAFMANELVKWVAKSTVHQYNDVFSHENKRHTAALLQQHNEPEIERLLLNSLPGNRHLQDLQIKEYVGNDANAVAVFKNLPAEQAVSRAKDTEIVYLGTKKRLAKNTIFLLPAMQRNLMADIVSNTEEKETATGTKKVIYVDAAMYNKIAQDLTPRLRQVLRNTKVVVDRTFVEKLTCTGAYCVIGAVGGAMIGAGIGGTKHLPDEWTDILVDYPAQLAVAALVGANKGIAQQPELAALRDKGIEQYRALETHYQQVAQQREFHTTGHTQPGNFSNFHSGPILSSAQELVRGGKELHNDLQNVSRSEKKAFTKRVVKEVALESAKIVKNDSRSFNAADAKAGACVGALVGGCFGAGFGLYQAQKPLVERDISMIGRVTPGKKLMTPEEKRDKKRVQELSSLRKTADGTLRSNN